MWDFKPSPGFFPWNNLSLGNSPTGPTQKAAKSIYGDYSRCPNISERVDKVMFFFFFFFFF